ncbi:MAG: hypothetical protein PVJ34_05340 [Anaerolineae bacterium]|jgi:hypothetical protein
MLHYTETHFAGYDCLKLENGALALWLTRNLGPRIIGLALEGGDNLFAELPDETADCPGVGAFSFRGGHRLWYAPEHPPHTYLPDDEPLDVAEIDRGLRLIQPVEAPTGIQKSLAVTLPGPEARVVVDHTLHNRGFAPVELAPWAITQLRPGGLAVLPQATDPADAYGLLPNRHVVLWPYTRPGAPYLAWGDRYLFVSATMSEGAFKVGFPNPAGWLAYALEGSLFVKQADYRPDADYYDRGSSSECYCNPRFLELETLGPKVTLAPGASVSHRETWTLHPGASLRPDEDQVAALADELGL